MTPYCDCPNIPTSHITGRYSCHPSFTSHSCIPFIIGSQQDAGLRSQLHIILISRGANYSRGSCRYVTVCSLREG